MPPPPTRLRWTTWAAGSLELDVGVGVGRDAATRDFERHVETFFAAAAAARVEGEDDPNRDAAEAGSPAEFAARRRRRVGEQLASGAADVVVGRALVDGLGDAAAGALALVIRSPLECTLFPLDVRERLAEKPLPVVYHFHVFAFAHQTPRGAGMMAFRANVDMFPFATHVLATRPALVSTFAAALTTSSSTNNVVRVVVGLAGTEGPYSYVTREVVASAL